MGLFDKYYQDPVRMADEAAANAAVKRDPLGQLAYEGQMARQGADRGFREAVGGATGVDMRDEVQKAAAGQTAVKQAIAGIDPSDIDRYYPALIRALGAAGMVDQAREAAAEYRKMKAEAAAGALKAREQTRKETKDVQSNAIATAKLGDSAPETIKLLNMLNDLDPLAPGTETTQKALLARLNKLAEGKGVAFAKTNDRWMIYDQATGAAVREGDLGVKAESAKDKAKKEAAENKLQGGYDQTMLKMQGIYDSIVRLAQHPGTVKLVGWLTGKAGDVGDEKAGGFASEAALAYIGDNGRAALALYNQIGGQAFLGALLDLKRESAAAGAKGTGLGALSDAEGKRIERAAAAIGLRQSPESFYKALAVYAGEIAKTVELINQQAQRDGLTPKAFNAPAITMPTGRRGARPAATAPAATPTGRVRVRAPDGQTGTIRLEELDEAKKQGYTEVR